MNWGTGLFGFLADRMAVLPVGVGARLFYVNGKKYRLKPGIMSFVQFKKRFKIPRGHEIVRIWYGYRNIPQEITMCCGYVEHGNQGKYKEEFVSRKPTVGV